MYFFALLLGSLSFYGFSKLIHDVIMKWIEVRFHPFDDSFLFGDYDPLSDSESETEEDAELREERKRVASDIVDAVIKEVIEKLEETMERRAYDIIALPDIGGEPAESAGKANTA